MLNPEITTYRNLYQAAEKKFEAILETLITQTERTAIVDLARKLITIHERMEQAETELRESNRLLSLDYISNSPETEDDIPF